MSDAKLDQAQRAKAEALLEHCMDDEDFTRETIYRFLIADSELSAARQREERLKVVLRYSNCEHPHRSSSGPINDRTCIECGLKYDGTNTNALMESRRLAAKELADEHAGRKHNELETENGSSHSLADRTNGQQ